MGLGGGEVGVGAETVVSIRMASQFGFIIPYTKLIF